MNSLMFTFSANQFAIELDMRQKNQQHPSKRFRRRPSTSKSSNNEKNRSSSLNNNQLFENSHQQSSTLDESLERNMNLFKLKNTPSQLQEKKKLRTIIDNMLGKNFDSQNCPNIDPVSISSRKNIQKQRVYLNGQKPIEQKQRLYREGDSKQNQINLDNTKDYKYFQAIQNQQKLKTNSNPKLKKFQFAPIKFNKMNYLTQRYQLDSREESIQSMEMKCVNLSKESIDRESFAKKILKSKTPKIMYPQSDSKLPSVFRTHNTRAFAPNSLRTRPRVSSAYFISENEDKKTEQTVINQQKRTIQIPTPVHECLRTKFRPKSTMIQAKRHSTYVNRNQTVLPSNFHPRRFILEYSQELSNDISKKLGLNHRQSNPVTVRANKRTKSTHGNYIHRKLREINAINQEINWEDENKLCVKNESLHSRQTAEESTMVSSIERTLPNTSDKLGKSIDTKQFSLGMGMGYSVTFQVQKE